MEVRQKLEALVQSPLYLFSGFAAVACTVWGLFEIYQFLRDQIGSNVAAIFLALALALLVLPALLTLVWSNFHRQFHLPRGQRMLHPTIMRTWRIDKQGAGLLENRAEYLFFHEPHPEDLADVFFSSLPLEFPALGYQTDDADIENLHQPESGVLKVHWKPRGGDIAIGTSISHAFTCRFPPGPNPQRKSYSIAAAAYTASYTLKVVSERPIARAVCYKKKIWQSFKRPESIFTYAERVRKTDAPPPSLVDKNSVECRINCLHPGTMYYLVLHLE